MRSEHSNDVIEKKEKKTIRKERETFKERQKQRDVFRKIPRKRSRIRGGGWRQEPHTWYRFIKRCHVPERSKLEEERVLKEESIFVYFC